jgi:Carboxypeptidase regulatory-like domain
MSKRISIVLAICAMAIMYLCLSSTAVAQFRTSIQGVVTDPQRLTVPGATFTLKNLSTNETVTRTSNEAGVFNFNALPVSTFSLVVEKAGFTKKVLNNLQLIPEQPNALNVQLALDATSVEVNVDASMAPALDTETASLSGVVSDNQIQHLPSQGRDVFTLVQLAPGVFGDQAQAAGGGRQMRTAASTRPTASPSTASARSARCGVVPLSSHRQKTLSETSRLSPMATTLKTDASVVRRLS